LTRLRWSPTAARDLESIRHSSAAGGLLVDRIRAAIDRALAFPRIGRRVGEIEHCEVRELIVRPFRIVYRVRPDSIEIVAIFHSSRLPPWTSE